MDALNITFANGEQVSFPFNAGSTIAVDTPDGVNGSQRGVWGEVVNVEYVKDATAAVDAPAVDSAPAETVPVADVPEDVTPDPSEAVAQPAAGSETNSDTSGTTPPDDTPAV